MKKKLLNPRGYLSWTQVDMWIRSPDRYVRQYMHGESGFNNDAMRFGSRTSQALENGAETGDELLDAVVALLPHYDKREHEIRANLTTSAGDVTLLGKLDTFGLDPLRLREYKTGRVKWTQAKAEKHRQIHHYEALIYLFHGSLPVEAWLDWAQTEWVDGELAFTGNLQSFPVKHTMSDVLQYMALVSKVAREIDEVYRKELKKMA